MARSFSILRAAARHTVGRRPQRQRKVSQLIEPFQGQVVRPERAAEVISPAFDAFTPQQRIAHRDRFPLSYLQVTRSASDEPAGTDVSTEALVDRGRRSLERLLDADVFAPQGEPAFLIYELETANHVQRGVVGEVEPSRFAERSLPHEGVRPERAELLAAHFSHVRAASSPVTCTVDDGAELKRALQQIETAALLLDHDSGDGLRQRVWRVNDADQSRAIQAAVDKRPFFIVDGHHRAAANRRLLEAGRPMPQLIALFPPETLGLAGFHRLVSLGELTPVEFVQRVRRRFVVEDLASPAEPSAGSVVMAVDGRWLRVRFDERPVAGSGLVHLGALDPSIVEREIVNAIVARPGAPADVSYLPGTTDLDFVASHAESEGRIPILVAPIDIADMIKVAAGGVTMPPKSTYFVPKARSGVFLRLL